MAIRRSQLSCRKPILIENSFIDGTSVLDVRPKHDTVVKAQTTLDNDLAQTGRL